MDGETTGPLDHGPLEDRVEMGPTYHVASVKVYRQQSRPISAPINPSSWQKSTPVHMGDPLGGLSSGHLECCHVAADDAGIVSRRIEHWWRACILCPWSIAKASQTHFTTTLFNRRMSIMVARQDNRDGLPF